MVILGTRNKITDFLMILAWASPFNMYFKKFASRMYTFKQNMSKEVCVAWWPEAIIRQAGTSIVRSSTVTRHAAPMGQCTGPHLSVGSIYYNAEVYPYSVWRAPPERGGLYPLCSGPFIPPERGGLPSVQWALHPS